MPDRYDSTADFILVRRKDGSTVVVPPTGSLFLPVAFDSLEEAHGLVRKVLPDGGQVWLFEHEHPAALEPVRA